MITVKFSRLHVEENLIFLFLTPEWLKGRLMSTPYLAAIHLHFTLGSQWSEIRPQGCCWTSQRYHLLNFTFFVKNLYIGAPERLLVSLKFLSKKSAWAPCLFSVMSFFAYCNSFKSNFDALFLGFIRKHWSVSQKLTVTTASAWTSIRKPSGKQH